MTTSTTPVTPPDLIGSIRELVEICGPTVNKDDKAIVAIELCITEGIDTERHIIGCLMRAGLDNRHAGAVLKRNAGPSPNAHRWWLGADGRYHLHAEARVSA